MIGEELIATFAPWDETDIPGKTRLSFDCFVATRHEPVSNEPAAIKKRNRSDETDITQRSVQ